jgi:hypothetical protein
VVPNVHYLNRVREEEQQAQEEKAALENREPEEGVVQFMLN